MYQCDESQHFIMSCINMIETGSHREISATLLKFLRYTTIACTKTNLASDSAECKIS